MDKHKQKEKQTEAREIHHEDLALKTAAQYFGEELLPLLGIPGEVKYIGPTESVKLEARQMYQDFNYFSEEGVLMHLEFESDSVTREDLRRFREYEAAASRTFQCAVITYVICTSKVKHLRTELAEGINRYRVKLVRLKDSDSDQLFSALDRKQKQGKMLEKADLVPLLLTPLMSGSLEIGERIIKSLLFLQNSGNAVTDMEQEKMFAVLYTLADKFLDEKELSRVKEILAMTKLGTMLFNDGKAEGKAEGIVLY
nr:hypothetical protein [uncultured Eisenbergiella sp.]